MSNIVAVLIVRCRHTGVYADGRPNTASVTIYDLDEITIQKNRTRAVPVPFGSGTTRPPVDIPMSTRTFVSWHEGALCKLTNLGLITTEIILQLRDKGNCGGPAGTGQALQPAVLNVERTGDSLRLVIPDNVLPTNLDSIGFMVGEPVTITGFKEPGVPPVYRGFDGEYEISVATPGSGLSGVAAGSYLIEVPLPAGAPQPLVTLSTINICLTEGRVVSQFNSTGDVGGFGPNVFGYVGGMFLPHAASGGGAGTIAVYDGGVLIDAAATTIDFIGAGVVASSAGAGLVDVTIAGGGGGGETLAQTLVLGNITAGTNLLVSTGDGILGVTDLVLSPGAGVADNVIIDGLTWPSADGTAGQALITDSFGILSFGNPTPGLAVQNEGVTFETAPTTFNFIGAGVVASSGGAGIVDVTISGGGGGGAPVNAEYVVMSLDGALTNERVLTAGTGIAIVDGGANSPVTLSVDATLAEVLANGNLTGGNDIYFSTGDSLTGITDLVLDPGAGGSDNVILDGLTWPGADGSAGEALITNGAGILSFGAPTPAPHAPTHVHDGTDEIDGDILDITFIPTNYTRDTTPPEVTSVEELTAHLAGLDNALGDLEAKPFTAGEALTAGDLLTLDTAGEVVRANSSIAGGLWEVIGVSAASVLIGAIVRVFTKSGTCPPVRFGAAPLVAANGTLVFLDSTSGLTTVTPPTTSGNTLFTVGTLQGADGITTTPTVVFRPQFLVQRR